MICLTNESTILPNARTTLSMSFHKALPKIFGRVHPRYLTPWFSTLVFSVASAVMYVGGPENASALIASYLDGGTLGRGEVGAGLLPLLRFRWAVQANYFAWRIATNNLTGISGPEDNEAGLEDARLSLRELG